MNSRRYLTTLIATLLAALCIMAAASAYSSEEAVTEVTEYCDGSTVSTSALSGSRNDRN